MNIESEKDTGPCGEPEKDGTAGSTETGRSIAEEVVRPETPQEAKWEAEVKGLEERLRRDYDPSTALKNLVRYMNECIPEFMYSLPTDNAGNSNGTDLADFLDDKGRYFLYNGLQRICQAILSRT